MRILFDPQAFGLGYSGMFRYYTSLYNGLKQAGIEIVHPEKPPLLPKPAHRLKIRSALHRLKNRFTIYQTKKKYFRALSQADYDLVYITAPHFEIEFLKYIKNKPFVMTVHDTMQAVNGFHTFFDQPRGTAALGYLAHHAERVICVSDYTRNDLCTKYGLDRSRTRTVYLANFLTEAAGEVENLPDSYILFVGSRDGRKNFFDWIKAVAPYLSKHPEVHVAITGPLTDIEKFFCRKLGVESNLRSFENVTDAQLNTLYRNSLCLVYPSLYEGFGLPVLEAMANGCPVITSNCTSIPEVAGNAALLIDPLDADMMLESLKTVIGNANVRKKLTKKGLEQSKKFSGEKFISEMIGCFDQAIHSFKH